jgi:hypothetical protein
VTGQCQGCEQKREHNRPHKKRTNLDRLVARSVQYACASLRRDGEREEKLLVHLQVSDLSNSEMCTLSVLRMATSLRVRGAGKSSKSRGGGAAHGLLHWLRSKDVALSKAVFMRFGHTHGRGRRCVQRCASCGVTVRQPSVLGRKQAARPAHLHRLPIRGLKAVERLGQGYLWFGVPIVILLVSQDSGLRRDAATWLFAMLVDLVTIAGIKVRSLPRRLCVFYVRLTSCSTGRCASTTAVIQCGRYVGHQRRQVLLPERWVLPMWTDAVPSHSLMAMQCTTGHSSRGILITCLTVSCAAQSGMVRTPVGRVCGMLCETR